jgi:hypothetical protein
MSTFGVSGAIYTCLEILCIRLRRRYTSEKTFVESSNQVPPFTLLRGENPPRSSSLSDIQIGPDEGNARDTSSPSIGVGTEEGRLPLDRTILLLRV